MSGKTQEEGKTLKGGVQLTGEGIVFDALKIIKFSLLHLETLERTEVRHATAFLHESFDFC